MKYFDVTGMGPEKSSAPSVNMALARPARSIDMETARRTRTSLHGF